MSTMRLRFLGFLVAVVFSLPSHQANAASLTVYNNGTWESNFSGDQIEVGFPNSSATWGMGLIDGVLSAEMSYSGNFDAGGGATFVTGNGFLNFAVGPGNVFSSVTFAFDDLGGTGGTFVSGLSVAPVVGPDGIFTILPVLGGPFRLEQSQPPGVNPNLEIFASNIPEPSAMGLVGLAILFGGFRRWRVGQAN